MTGATTAQIFARSRVVLLLRAPGFSVTRSARVSLYPGEKQRRQFVTRDINFFRGLSRAGCRFSGTHWTGNGTANHGNSVNRTSADSQSAVDLGHARVNLPQGRLVMGRGVFRR